MTQAAIINISLQASAVGLSPTTAVTINGVIIPGKY